MRFQHDIMREIIGAFGEMDAHMRRINRCNAHIVIDRRRSPPLALQP